MSLRRVVRSGLVLLSALGAAAVPLTWSSTTQAPAAHTTSSTAAAPWSFIRRACKTVTEGTICVNLEGNGQPSTYRVVYQLQAHDGYYMRALTTATWLTHVYGEGVGAYATYRPLCSGGIYGCAFTEGTQPQTYVVSSPYFAVYTMIVDTSLNHRLEISAGVTPMVSDGSEGCGLPGEADIAGALTSTSDGTVYWGRRGGSTDYRQEFALADHTTFTGSPTTFFHHWARSDHKAATTTQQYLSPTFYIPWQRRPASEGGWTTQHSSSSTESTSSSFEGPPVC